jgi:hypothetical protein
MSLGAQIGGENKLVWRAIFTVTSVIAIVSLLRLIAVTSDGKTPGKMHSMRWLLVLIYAVVLVVALLPDLTKPLNLSALQVESFLLTLLVLGGHGLAWELLSKPRVREAKP